MKTKTKLSAVLLIAKFRKKDGSDSGSMNHKILYYIYISLFIILTSCISVVEKNIYIQKNPSKWISYHPYKALCEHVYYFSDSVRNISQQERTFGFSYIDIEFFERSLPVYTTFLFIPFFPDFLFYSWEDKKFPIIDIYIHTENDSIVFNPRNIKFIANDKIELNSVLIDEYGTIRVDGKKHSFRCYTIDSNYKDCDFGYSEPKFVNEYLDKIDILQTKYIEDYNNLSKFDIITDTVTKLTIKFDSVEVRNKMQYIEPLTLYLKNVHFWDFWFFR